MSNYEIKANWDSLFDQSADVTNEFIRKAPEDFTMDQKLEFARICVMNWTASTIAVKIQCMQEGLEYTASLLADATEDMRQ